MLTEIIKTLQTGKRRDFEPDDGKKSGKGDSSLG